MVQITIKLSGPAERVVVPDPGRPGHPLVLTPLFEGAATPELAGFYTAEAPGQHLETVLQRLREHPLVESAYVKPPDAPP